MAVTATGVEVVGAPADDVLTPGALALVARLQRELGPRRTELLAARVERQARIDAGELPEFLEETPESDRLWFEQRPPKDFDFD